jgi:hypothetical protein
MVTPSRVALPLSIDEGLADAPLPALATDTVLPNLRS